MNTAFFDATGKCLGIAEGDQMDMVFPEAAFRSIVGLGANANEICYKPEVGVTSRQPFAVTVSLNTISNIPAGTEAVMASSSVVVEDGVLELDVLHPQTIRVTLIHPLYLETAVEVHCEA